jgi:hypothetical protein
VLVSICHIPIIHVIAMDVSLQDFARYLAASAGAMSPDESTMCLIVEEDGDLIEKMWTGTEVSDQVFIASDVKKSTPAVYLVNQNVVGARPLRMLRTRLILDIEACGFP